MHESECDIELTPKRIEKCRIDSKQLCDIQTNEILQIQRKHGDLRAVINHTLTKLKNVYSVIGRARHG